jgi:hypothetical protein
VGRDGEIYRGDLVSEKQKYFCKWDWTGRNHEPSLICPTGKSDDPAGEFFLNRHSGLRLRAFVLKNIKNHP